MLDVICKKDAKWRKIALYICKDKQLADDVVQEMYLKLSECKKQINDFYVICTLRSVFLDIKRKNKESELIEDITKDSTSVFEPNDYEQYILNEFSKLKWIERELIEESYYKSFRDISKDLNGLDYGFIFRTHNKALKKLLGNDFDLYKNSNLKYKNNAKTKRK